MKLAELVARLPSPLCDRHSVNGLSAVLSRWSAAGLIAQSRDNVGTGNHRDVTERDAAIITGLLSVQGQGPQLLGIVQRTIVAAVRSGRPVAAELGPGVVVTVDPARLPRLQRPGAHQAAPAPTSL